MLTTPVEFIELEIETLKTLARVCQQAKSYRTVDRIQKRIHEIEVQASTWAPHHYPIKLPGLPI
jgi:hypothetical protein